MTPRRIACVLACVVAVCVAAAPVASPVQDPGRGDGLVAEPTATSAPAAAADNWPAFRGPEGMPLGHDPALPETWSPTENVEWAADVPGVGWSSPIVWEGKVFLTSATSDQPMKQPSLGVDFSNDYVAELQAQGLSQQEIMEKVTVRDNELWYMGGFSDMPITTPFAAGGLLYLAAGPPGAGPIAVVRPGAEGDISLAGNQTSSEDVVWFDWSGGTYLPTPLVWEGALYVLQHNGIFIKYDARSGDVIYRARIAPGAAAFTASPWAYNDRIFCLSEEGDTYVIGTGDEYELLGVNSLEEFSMATPAMVGDRLLLRTQERLYSIRNTGE